MSLRAPRRIRDPREAEQIERVEQIERMIAETRRSSEYQQQLDWYRAYHGMDIEALSKRRGFNDGFRAGLLYAQCEAETATAPDRSERRMTDVNTHADLAALLERARELRTNPPNKARLGHAQIEGCLSVNDVRWVHLAAAFIEAVVTELEPGALRDSGGAR